eukprot:GHVU01002892.1.p1 GENE.GHVU01002892.1~~GHVU01002892.1.p1  ORF type:complete len:111 (-),score=4.11 GHVU01002892.1:362-694(-)
MENDECKVLNINSTGQSSKIDPDILKYVCPIRTPRRSPLKDCQRVVHARHYPEIFADTTHLIYQILIGWYFVLAATVVSKLRAATIISFQKAALAANYLSTFRNFKGVRL